MSFSVDKQPLQKNLMPFTPKQLVERAKISEQDIKNGRTIELSQVRRFFEKQKQA